MSGISRRELLKLAATSGGVALVGTGCKNILEGRTGTSSETERDIQGVAVLDHAGVKVYDKGELLPPGEAYGRVTQETLSTLDAQNYKPGSTVCILDGGVLTVSEPNGQDGRALSVIWPDGLLYHATDTVGQNTWAGTREQIMFAPREKAVHVVKTATDFQTLKGYLDEHVAPGLREGKLLAYAVAAQNTIDRMRALADKTVSVYSLRREADGSTTEVPRIPMGSMFYVRLQSLLAKYAQRSPDDLDITPVEIQERLQVMAAVSEAVHLVSASAMEDVSSTIINNSESQLNQFIRQNGYDVAEFAEVLAYFRESIWTKDSYAAAIVSLNALVALPQFGLIKQEGLSQLFELLCYRPYLSSDPVDTEEVINDVVKNSLAPIGVIDKGGLLFTPELAGMELTILDHVILDLIEDPKVREKYAEMLELLAKRAKEIKEIPEAPIVMALVEKHIDDVGRESNHCVIIEKRPDGTVKIVMDRLVGDLAADFQFWNQYAAVSHLITSDQTGRRLTEMLGFQFNQEPGLPATLTDPSTGKVVRMVYNAALLEPSLFLSINPMGTESLGGENFSLRWGLQEKPEFAEVTFDLGGGVGNPGILFFGEGGATAVIRAFNSTDNTYGKKVWWQPALTEARKEAAMENRTRLCTTFGDTRGLISAMGSDSFVILKDNALGNPEGFAVSYGDSFIEELATTILPDESTYAVVTRNVTVLETTGSGSVESYLFGASLSAQLTPVDSLQLKKGDIVTIQQIGFTPPSEQFPGGEPFAIVSTRHALNPIESTYFVVPLEAVIPQRTPTLVDTFKTIAISLAALAAFSAMPLGDGYYMWMVLARFPLYIFAPLGGLPIPIGMEGDKQVEQFTKAFMEQAAKARERVRQTVASALIPEVVI